MDNPQRKTRIIVISGITIMIAIIIVGILGAMGVFHKSPYSAMTKIENFNKYLKGTPVDVRDNVSASLYGVISLNVTPSSATPEKGAYIRDNSVTNSFNEDTNVHFSTFLVDIPAIEQTYYAQVTWSPDPQADLGGYPIVINCPLPKQMIYTDFNCKDVLSENKFTDLYNKNPIMDILPIVISYYSQETGKLISYRISYKTLDNNNRIKIVINDYTGGNRDRAIQTLKDKGISNPEQYEIEYIDDSIEEFIPSSHDNQ